MHITLASPVARDRAAAPYDVKQMKKALNRLGLYVPLDKVGITGFADNAMFDALKQFQTTHGLKPNGIVKPDNETIVAINAEISITPTGSYVWRSVGDNKVRSAHAAFNGTMRSWADSPDPGEDYNCRCWAEMIASDSAEDRKKAILGDVKADFRLKPDLEPHSEAPWHMLERYSEVEKNEKEIEKEALKAGLDADLIKAIIYVETTQGYYDRIAGRLNESIRPMNIQAEYWKELGYTREDLEDPVKNIRAGVKLLKNISMQMPKASIAEIATIYNELGAKRVNDYGARIERIHKEKPWEK